MVDKKVEIILTQTYLKSLDRIKDPIERIAVEKKVNKLIENPSLAQPMCYQHEGFCEIHVGKNIRVYCIRLEGKIIVFIMGIVDDHKKSYKKSQEYEKLFSELRKVKEEFKDKNKLMGSA